MCCINVLNLNLTPFSFVLYNDIFGRSLTIIWDLFNFSFLEKNFWIMHFTSEGIQPDLTRAEQLEVPIPHGLGLLRNFNSFLGLN